MIVCWRPSQETSQKNNKTKWKPLREQLQTQICCGEKRKQTLFAFLHSETERASLRCDSTKSNSPSLPTHSHRFLKHPTIAHITNWQLILGCKPSQETSQKTDKPKWKSLRERLANSKLALRKTVINYMMSFLMYLLKLNVFLVAAIAPNHNSPSPIKHPHRSATHPTIAKKTHWQLIRCWNLPMKHQKKQQHWQEHCRKGLANSKLFWRTVTSTFTFLRFYILKLNALLSLRLD